MTTNTDLAELKEERGASIGYFDATFLIELQSHLSQKRGGAEIFCPPESIIEKLSELYPDVAFRRGEGEPQKYAPVVAEVKPESEATLREALGITFLVPEEFEGVIYEDQYGIRGISSLEEGRIVFCQDGFGYIEDGSTEFFSHTLDLAKLKEEAGGDEDEIEDNLRQYFHEEINGDLDDPYIDPGDLEDQDVHFLSGSEEELERLVQLFVLTEPEIEESAGEYVCIRTATEDDSACLDPDGGYYSERLNSLVELALESNEPEGWTHEYNDGPANQASGYSLCSSSITYNIEDILELPARVRMAARRDLKQWLESQGRTIEEFDPEPFVAASEEASLPADANEAEGAGGDSAADEEVDVLFPTVTLNFAPAQSTARPQAAE